MSDRDRTAAGAVHVNGPRVSPRMQPGSRTRRRRDVDVLTAFEDGSHEEDDPPLLDRASALGRVLFSTDDDLLQEAVRRQRAGEPFSFSL